MDVEPQDVSEDDDETPTNVPDVSNDDDANIVASINSNVSALQVRIEQLEQKHNFIVTSAIAAIGFYLVLEVLISLFNVRSIVSTIFYSDGEVKLPPMPR